MEKRVILIVLLVSSLFHSRLSAQDDKVTVRTEHQIGRTYPLKQAVLPWKPSHQTFTVHEKATGADDPNPMHPLDSQNIELAEKVASTNAFIVNVGRNFEGNHLTDGTPSDNNLAISNDGLIVSVDNYSIAYFKENGDTITQFGLPLSKLYNDTTMDRTPFDPRVIYDSYNDRFVLVSLFHSFDFTQSRLLLSFSKPLVADTVEWIHYQIDCDSVFTGATEGFYHFDYPNLSVTKNQLIVTCRIADHNTATGSNPLVSNVIFQIDKSSGYNAMPVLNRKDWKNVENTESMKNLNLVPAMDAFQGLSSDTVVYLVTNYKNNSTKFFWFELNGSVNSPTAQITAHGTLTNFFYSVPSYASQQGGNGGDRISVLDCDIQYCLLQNNKLHFVFTRSNNGWAELVYANIGIGTNAFFSSTFDRVGDSENLLQPSIACYGQDSTDENYLIGFLRTGPNQFADVSVINYDSSGWSIVPTTVMSGHGIINLRQDLVAPWDSLERLGDYTCIQRRYSDPFRRCWMVGAHAFGLGANHFGIVSGVSAWIAELGDSLPALGTASIEIPEGFNLYPNPATSTQTITLNLSTNGRGNVSIFDALGSFRQSIAFSGNSIEFSPSGLASGMYFVRIEVNGKNYETKKMVIRN